MAYGLLAAIGLVEAQRVQVGVLTFPRPAEERVEIVERKGIGHPDSICDGVAEAVAVALANEYSQRFGRILHYNVDKGLLVAGQVRHAFGGGRQLKKMRMIIGDRATVEYHGQRLPIGEIAAECARSWIATHLRHVHPEDHVTYENALAPGSPELSGILSRPDGVSRANDTSAAVGYYPMSDTERLTLATERHLNSSEFKAAWPDTGEDVKVMAVRRDDRVELTVAMPLLETMIRDEDSYFERKTMLEDALAHFANTNRGGLSDVCVRLNCLDRRGAGLSGVYLSLLGTSAEDADSGQVGRGNRVNGLISLNRPASAEAAAGKNPVSHVGKVYNVFTHVLAERIYQAVPGVQEVWVWLCSRIGDPIDRPALFSVQFVPGSGLDPTPIEREVAEFAQSELEKIVDFSQALTAGRFEVF